MITMNNVLPTDYNSRGKYINPKISLAWTQINLKNALTPQEATSPKLYHAQR